MVASGLFLAVVDGLFENVLRSVVDSHEHASEVFPDNSQEQNDEPRTGEHGGHKGGPACLHAGVGEAHDETMRADTMPITPRAAPTTAATRRGTMEKFRTVDQRRMSDLRLYPDVPWARS